MGSLQVEGIDHTLERLAKWGSDVAYLRMEERDRAMGTEDHIGTFLCTAQAAIKWLPSDHILHDERAMVLAGCQVWLAQTITNAMAGRTSSAFRVRMYAPKGSRQLDSSVINVTNPDVEDTPPGRQDLLTLAQAPRLSASIKEASENLELRTGYTLERILENTGTFTNLAMSPLGQVTDVYKAMVSNLMEQIRGKDDIIQALTNKLVEKEIRLAEIQSGTVDLEQRRALHRETVLPFVGLAEKALEAFMISKGVPPSLATALAPLSSDPELVKAVEDPRFKVLLGDPDGRAMLKQFFNKFLNTVEMDGGSGTTPQGVSP